MDAEQLARYVILHQMGAERLSLEQAARAVRILNISDRQLTDLITSRYSAIAADGFDRGPATTLALEQTFRIIRAINDEAYKAFADETRSGLTDAAEYEIDFTNRALRASATVDLRRLVPDPIVLRTLVERSPIATNNTGGAAVLDSWIKHMSASRQRRIEDEISGALSRGGSTDDLMKSIRGSRKDNYAGSIFQGSRRSAQTLCFTAYSTIQNEARLTTFRETRTVSHVEWSSVIDGLTSKGCREKSGKLYPIDQPHPVPPAHPNCRALLIPRRDTNGNRHEVYNEVYKNAKIPNIKTIDDLKRFDDDLLS